jgi:hypothetical protein
MLARTRGTGQTKRQVSPALEGRGDAREEFLLALLLRYPSLRQEGMALEEGLLWQTENRELLAAWRQASDADSLREALPPELQAHLEHLLAHRLPEFGEGEAQAALADCLRGLERRRLQLEKQATAAALAAQEEEVGPVPLAKAATGLEQGQQDPDTSDASLAQAAVRLRLDLEAGLRLHATADKGKESEEDVSADEAEVRME